MDKNSLTHTKWECKYRLVFAPKYRRQVIYGKIKADIGRILRELCERKECKEENTKNDTGNTIIGCCVRWNLML